MVLLLKVSTLYDVAPVIRVLTAVLDRDGLMDLSTGVQAPTRNRSRIDSSQ